MKITDLRVVVHERKMPASFGPPVMHLGVMTIATDEGVDGHVFISPPHSDPTPNLVRVVKPMLLGRDPLDIGAIWHDIARRGFALGQTEIGLVDMALWDIAGKVAGLPVHRLLGTCRNEIPAYASSWVHRDDSTYVEEALAYRERGLAGYKLHPPTQRRKRGESVTVAADLATCAAVRDAVGDGYCLMFDSPEVFSYAEALKIGFGIQDLGYHWLEDPLPSSDIGGYLRLKQHLSIPIVATETTVGGLHALTQWASSGATDALRGDTVGKGGITGMMKISHLAEAYHLQCEVHDGYNAIGNLATVHVCLAMRNCEMFEVIAIHEDGSYDVDHLSYGLAEPIAIDASGMVRAPERPGLGIDVDWDLIRSNVVAELS